MTSARRAGVAAFGIVLAASTIAFTQAPPPQAPGSPGPQAAPPSKESVQKAGQVLAEARKALGGDKLEQLKSLVASGRTKRIRGNNLVPIEFEMLFETPDKYVRIDEFPAEDTDPSSAGFNGDNLIQNPPRRARPGGRAAGPGAAPVAPPGPPAAGPRAAPPAGATPPAGAAATPPADPPPAGAARPSGAGPGTMPPGMMPPGGMPGGRGP